MRFGVRMLALVAVGAYYLGRDAQKREQQMGQPLTARQHFRILGQQAQQQYSVLSAKHGEALSRIGDFF